MIYVFKTSVKTKRLVQQLKPFLDHSLQQSKWNFDLDDCDKILRIESTTEISEAVNKLLKANGFDCEELTE